MYLKKDYAKPHFQYQLKSSKTEIKCTVWDYNILERTTVYYMQPVSCQHREQHISKCNYEISEVWEIHISRLELQKWSLEFVISSSKGYICDLGLRFR
jgi:hypothetical protein